MELTGQRFQTLDGGYRGVIYEDTQHPTVMAAFDTFTDMNVARVVVGIDYRCAGTTYLFVTDGRAVCSDRHGDVHVGSGQWFVSPEPIRVDFDPMIPTRLVALTRLGYHGMRGYGGPIEPLGRLRYIDRCSDTCLVQPPLLGEPCLNHLHFPPGIEQTFHTHPSLRAGIVAAGEGYCETLDDPRIPLRPGTLWIIPTDTVHRFVTEGSTLDVIAYHPDSDFGPTHEDHPMINRTWVDGAKMDNASGVHALAEIVDAWPVT